MSKGKILFQLTGSIACFKACQVLSKLIGNGYEVEVVATPSALSFVGEATLEGLTGRPIHSDTFARGQYMDHIHLARWADLIVICPATANTINKLASGIADDLIGTLFLAHDFKKPYVIAPAMNERMLWHPATQASIETLKAWGVSVLKTAKGALACGDTGEGRLLEPEAIFAEIERQLERRPEHQLSVLVTAGGTREPIDGVRSITNMSTGRTGVEIAERLASDGHRVTLVRAAEAVRPSREIGNLRERLFVTFSDLREALRDELSAHKYDAVIHAAAVGDFSVENVSAGDRVAATLSPGSGKIESCDQITLQLKRNPKIVDELRGFSRNPRLKVIAFKLTNTPRPEERREAVRKLARHAKPDFIVHNDLSEIFSNDTREPSGADTGLTPSHRARIFSAEDAEDPREVAWTEDKQKLALALEKLLVDTHSGERQTL